MNEIITIDNQIIQDKIFTIRGLQVMLDRDLAELYGVEPKRLNEQVKRNIDRFPDRFMFQLTKEEKYELVANCDRLQTLKFSTVNPYVFTEQGTSMLSAVLKSKTAVSVSIMIMDSFVNMRKFIAANSELLQRIEIFEKRQIGYELKSDEKFEKLFSALEDKSIKPTQGIFYDGQIFDAYVFVNDLIKNTKHSIVLIDNYIDESVLTLFSKNEKIEYLIYTRSISKQLKLDIEKYSSQYGNLTVKILKESHDRFIIVDKKKLYHIGASLKDLGKKWFAFSVIANELDGILARLESDDA
ncbi:MAG: ORF6N domain-containing protein [Campylobacterota bacterium]|nr:ORF6N domain-containing protein [Campylobacterota bacterium]